MNAILSDCPTTAAHVQELVEQIQATYFATPSAQSALGDPESRQALLGQLVLLDAVLQDGDMVVGELETLREELLSYLERLFVRLEAFVSSPAIVTEIESEFCEFVELFYDYGVAADATRGKDSE